MKKKIFIVTQDAVVNTIGGAITSFIHISNILSEKYNVYGLCYSNKHGVPELDVNVKFINLYYYYNEEIGFSVAINRFIKDNKPDIIIFFFAYLYVDANLSKEFNDIPRILLFRSRPDIYFAIHENTKYLNHVYVNTISQILFPSYYKLLPDFIKNSPVVCIPNSTKLSLEYVNTKVEHKKIIYLSRIDCWKGHYFLIKSFSKIANKYKDWSIDIYGQSEPQELQLQLYELVKCLHLEKQIHFCGITKEPLRTYLNYDFCVFPSYFEGFPNGLSDALSVGLPAIGFKNASGVNELIKDNINGFLTEESYNDFADKIERLICNKLLRAEFSINAIKQMKKYDYQHIKDTWFNLLSSILNKRFLQENFDYDSSAYVFDLFPISKLLSIKNKNNSFGNTNLVNKHLYFKISLFHFFKKFFKFLFLSNNFKK